MRGPVLIMMLSRARVVAGTTRVAVINFVDNLISGLPAGVQRVALRECNQRP